MEPHTLSDAEISQFKREGYLIKRRIIDQDYCATARERLWDEPAPSMKKEEPESWVGPFKSEEESDDLQNFKKGVRGADSNDSYGQQMRPMAMILADDAAINNVATYISTLK